MKEEIDLTRCPVCGSDSISVESRESGYYPDLYGEDKYMITEHCECSDCKATWDVDYGFDSVNTIIRN